MKQPWSGRLPTLQSVVFRCDGVDGAGFSEHINLVEPDVPTGTLDAQRRLARVPIPGYGTA